MFFPKHLIQRWINQFQCLLFSAFRIKDGHCKASPPKKTSEELRGVNNTPRLSPNDSEECPALQGLGGKGTSPPGDLPNANQTSIKSPPSQARFQKYCFHSQDGILCDGDTDCSCIKRRTLCNFFFKPSQTFIKRTSLHISKYSEEMTLQTHPFLYLQSSLLVHPWNTV